MKVIPLDFISCMKASIDVVGCNLSLSLVEVSFLEMASVVSLIFVEVTVLHHLSHMLGHKIG